MSMHPFESIRRRADERHRSLRQLSMMALQLSNRCSPIARSFDPMSTQRMLLMLLMMMIEFVDRRRAMMQAEHHQPKHSIAHPRSPIQNIEKKTVFNKINNLVLQHQIVSKVQQQVRLVLITKKKTRSIYEKERINELTISF